MSGLDFYFIEIIIIKTIVIGTFSILTERLKESNCYNMLLVNPQQNLMNGGMFILAKSVMKSRCVIKTYYIKE